MRKDALRNRMRLLEAADQLFRERGIGVSVSEIAAAAGMGRGTLFRNFPSKDALIAAVAAHHLDAEIVAGRELLKPGCDHAEAVFLFLTEVVERQQHNRALLQAVTDEAVCVEPEMRRVHAEFLQLLAELLERGKRAGSIRPEATATDLITLLKGLCMPHRAEAPPPPEAVLRRLDLLRAALTTPAYSRPLRGAPVALSA